MTKAIKPGDERGVTILLGGKRTLKIGDQMGTVIVPFLRLETDEDYEAAARPRPSRGGFLRRERAGA